MTPDQKALVSATVPILKEHGVALTTHFYHRLFAHHPELKNVFNVTNQQTGRQQHALALAVLAYAEHINDPAVLLPAVTRIGHKHTSLDVRPEQYAVVGEHLIASIGEVLGEAATPALLDAWATAYTELASLMSGVEQGLYQRAAMQPGGWTGWRSFIVRRKEEETADITSFYLYPADWGKVADFQPGQYVSVRLLLPEINLIQPRQYSLSSAPNGEYYRISVKKEAGNPQHPDGLLSNYLHHAVREGDTVEVSPPAGDFTLASDQQTPVVLISGGVGQTPLLSMLEQVVTSGSARPVVWVHGSRNRAAHAFRRWVTDVVAQHPNVQEHSFYETLWPGAPVQGHYPGFVDVHQLPAQALPAGADYYICGPAPFIRKQVQDLTALGVPATAIHFEEFGPATLAL
jgi:nitric oxide dioxygenase